MDVEQEQYHDANGFHHNRRIMQPPIGQLTEAEKNERATLTKISPKQVDTLKSLFLDCNPAENHDDIALARGFRTFLYASGYKAIYEACPPVETFGTNSQR